MIPSRVIWAAWALVPVAVVAYHFGPGQTAYVQDRAARLQAIAVSAEHEAMTAQDAAYAKHLEAIDARRAAFLDENPENAAKAVTATTLEEQAYANAAAAWKLVADRYQAVQAVLGDAAPADARAIRWAHARANVRAGEIWTGIEDLEALVTELDDSGLDRSPLATASREELATAYYYGARLLRLSGMPAQEWRIESGKARQQFRYLAERAENQSTSTGSDAARDAQKNLELVLNLEQSSLVELQGKPLPKESPRAGSQCNRPNGKRPGKSTLPPNRRDGRGAGGTEEIRDGW